jgi:hypothetical protein
MSRPSVAREVRRMWENDPLRNFSEARVGAWTPQTGGGYAGPYVCERCKKDVSGVYEDENGRTWQFSDCRELTRSRGEPASKPPQTPKSGYPAQYKSIYPT